jgi:hypothetical protein
MNNENEKLLAEGTYEAMIKDYGVRQNQKGVNQVVVVFGIKNGPNIFFNGGLGEKSIKHTTRNLITLGATPSNIHEVEKGLQGGPLSLNKVFELVVSHNTWEGKTRAQIKYINDPSKPRGMQFVKGTNALGELRGVAAALVAEQPELLKVNALPQISGDDVPF